jgi:hypothetical protein
MRPTLTFVADETGHLIGHVAAREPGHWRAGGTYCDSVSCPVFPDERSAIDWLIEQVEAQRQRKKPETRS